MFPRFGEEGRSECGWGLQKKDTFITASLACVIHLQYSGNSIRKPLKALHVNKYSIHSYHKPIKVTSLHSAAFIL